MIYGVYAIRDVRTGFLQPSFDVNDQAAMRNFSHAVVKSPDVLSSFSADFSLYKLADYDTDSGRITPLDLPLFLLDASSCIRSPGEVPIRPDAVFY